MEIGKLRRWRGNDPAFPGAIFFFQGEPKLGAQYFGGDLDFGKFWPEARSVADSERVVFDAFGVGRASLGQLLGPRVWIAAIKAMAAGFRQGKATGDVHQMPGMFLVREGRVAWMHAYAHAGDRPDLAVIPRNDST